MALPERHYYSLDLAAKKLKCDITDLLHYASIGLLELCVAIPKPPSPDEIIEETEDIDNRTDLNRVHYKPTIKYIDKNIKDNENSILRVKYETINTTIAAVYNVESEKFLKVGISGLLSIPFTDIKNFDCIEKESIEPHYLKIPRTEKKVAITPNIIIEGVFFYNPLKIKKDFLVITSEELSILNNGGKLITDRVFSKTFKDDTYFSFQEKTESKKSENLKSEFIKNLLIIKYGEKVAESPRSYLENDRSRIRIDFDEKGLTAPSGVTVNEWLK